MEKTYYSKDNNILVGIEDKITEYEKQELQDRKKGLENELADVNLLLSKFEK